MKRLEYCVLKPFRISVGDLLTPDNQEAVTRKSNTSYFNEKNTYVDYRDENLGVSESVVTLRLLKGGFITLLT